MTDPTQSLIATTRVVPVHTRCRDRARLEVRGLYRMPALKRRLEAALFEIGEIDRVSASTVTGRLLVCFAAPMTLQRLVALVDELLGAQPAGRRPPALPGYPEGRPLTGFTARAPV